MTKTGPVVAAAALLTLLLAGCGATEATDPAGGGAPIGDPVAGGTLVFSDVVHTTNLQTQTASAYPQSNILHSVLDRLTFFDADSGELVPWIAEQFDANETQTEFTFTIREGVTFSDGSPLDAHAVKANIEFLAAGSEQAQVPANPDFASVAAVAVDGNRVIVTLDSPNSNFPRATSAVTAGLVSLSTLALDNAGQADVEQIVGSGPFVFESQVPEQEIVFSSRDDYAWPPASADNQGAAYLDTLVIRAIPEVGLRSGAVQSGQVDVARGVQPADEEALVAAGKQVVAAPGVDLTANILGIRAENDILSDQRVREALQIGIDRDALKATVLSDSYEAAASILNHGSPGFVDLSSEIAFNPDRAAELLDDAGWTLGENGIREKDGVELKVAVGASSNSVVIKPGLEFVAEQWRELGVVLDNRAGDNTFASKAFADATVPLVGTRFFSWGALGPRLSDASNFITWTSSPSLNEVFAAEAATADPAAKADLLEQEQRALVLDEVLVIVLWDEVQVHGVDSDTHIEFTSSTAPDFHGAWKSAG